jgi:hypothetical protein
MWIQIRILLLILLFIKVMVICDDWSRLQCERPRLHFEPGKLMNLDFNAVRNPDSAFHSNADFDLDPAFKRIMWIRIRKPHFRSTVPVKSGLQHLHLADLSLSCCGGRSRGGKATPLPCNDMAYGADLIWGP